MSKRYTDEFRADVVRVARKRGSGGDAGSDR